MAKGRDPAAQRAVVLMVAKEDLEKAQGRGGVNGRQPGGSRGPEERGEGGEAQGSEHHHTPMLIPELPTEDGALPV